MKTPIGLCVLGAVTIFASAAIATDSAKPILVPQMSVVVKIKDHHNGGGGDHRHHGRNGDDGEHHHCKGNKCNRDDDAGRDDEDSVNEKDSPKSGTTTNDNVLWGDYNYDR